MEQGLSV